MKLQHCLGLGLAIGLAGCSPQRQPEQSTNNSSAPVLPAPSAPPAVANRPAPAQQPAKPPVDQKSTQAASDLVDRFAALLNQRKFDEAYALLGPGAPSRSEFDRRFSQYKDLNVTAGAAGDQEGAAGSIYLSIPLTIAGTAGTQHSTRSATAILRRVNDVPGSTEAQRLWHIERIDWEDAG
jgi:hypothetical protein